MLVIRIYLLICTAVVASTVSQPKRRNINEYNRPCLLAEFGATAKCYLQNTHLICDSGFSSDWIKGVHNEITQLTVLKWPGQCLNVGRLEQYFPRLLQLEIINSTRLDTFKGHFSSNSKIEKLLFRGLMSLWELPPDVIGQMQNLHELDLRHNVLRHMRPRLLRNPPSLNNVYLSENKWDCSDGGLDWLAMERENGTTRKRITDYKQLMCHQQLYRGKPLHRVMDIIKMVRAKCPVPCSCAMTHVVSNRAGDIIPLITVDCSNRNLSSPPTNLPPSTSTLKLEGNKINSVRLILQNLQYRKIADLYLDNNSIPSVKELEASEWFSSFRVLSLRGNLIKQIPVYAFDKAFQSNNNIMHVFLGNNPWRCDCHYTPRFQALLLKYKRVIRDLSDIRCSKSEDSVTSLAQISAISLGNICGPENVMPISTVDIVNLVLVFLILLVVGRFIYDWHNFKATGKLPWISSVLP